MMERYYIDRLEAICLGQEEDHLADSVEFDLSAWQKKYPQLTRYDVIVTSPAGVVYPAVTELDGDTLRWPVTKSDTAVAGEGQYCIVATGDGGARKSTAAYPLYICEGMPGMDAPEENAPDPQEGFIGKVIGAAERAEEQASAAWTAANEASASADAASGHAAQAQQMAQSAADFSGSAKAASESAHSTAQISVKAANASSASANAAEAAAARAETSVTTSQGFSRMASASAQESATSANAAEAAAARAEAAAQQALAISGELDEIIAAQEALIGGDGA